MEQTYKKNIEEADEIRENRIYPMLEEFDEIYPSVNIGYDGDEQDARFRAKVVGFIENEQTILQAKFISHLTSAHINMIDALVKEISEDNKWATQGESDDEKWKIHYGGYKEGVKNVITYLEEEKQKILNQTK